MAGIKVKGNHWDHIVLKLLFLSALVLLHVISRMLCLSLVVLLLLQLEEVAGMAPGGSVYACEGDMLQFACQSGVILVKSAKYGRPTGRTLRCGEAQNLHKACIADVTQYVKYRCDNHPICEIYVDVATFMMEMCPDILKYLDVTYDCVSSQTVERVTSCQMQCLPGSPYGGNNINGGNRYSGIPAAGGHPPAPHTPVHAPAPAPASAPAPAPSPARSPSTSQSHSAPQGTPAPAPAALPYSGPSVSHGFAARLASLQAQAQRAAALIQSSKTPSSNTGTGQSTTSGSSQPATSGTSLSGTSRAALLARMQTMLAALRARKAAQQAQQGQTQGQTQG